MFVSGCVCVCVCWTSRETVSRWVLVWTTAELTGNANKAPSDIQTTWTKQTHTHSCTHRCTDFGEQTAIQFLFQCDRSGKNIKNQLPAGDVCATDWFSDVECSSSTLSTSSNRVHLIDCRQNNRKSHRKVD